MKVINRIVKNKTEIFAWFFVLVWIYFFKLWISEFVVWNNFDSLAKFWDFVWWTVWSVWFLASILFFYESLTSQRRELKDARKEFKIHRVTNVIYKQIELYNKTLSKVSVSSLENSPPYWLDWLLTLVEIYSKDSIDKRLTHWVGLLNELDNFTEEITDTEFTNRLFQLNEDIILLKWFIIDTSKLERIQLKEIIKSNYHLEFIRWEFSTNLKYTIKYLLRKAKELGDDEYVMSEKEIRIKKVMNHIDELLIKINDFENT